VVLDDYKASGLCNFAHSISLCPLQPAPPASYLLALNGIQLCNVRRVVSSSYHISSVKYVSLVRHV
jgi:hypothetical protein